MKFIKYSTYRKYRNYRSGVNTNSRYWSKISLRRRYSTNDEINELAVWLTTNGSMKRFSTNMKMRNNDAFDN